MVRSAGLGFAVDSGGLVAVTVAGERGWQCLADLEFWSFRVCTVACVGVGV